MKKLLILLGITFPLLFFRLNSFAQNYDGYSITDYAQARDGGSLTFSSDVLLCRTHDSSSSQPYIDAYSLTPFSCTLLFTSGGTATVQSSPVPNSTLHSLHGYMNFNTMSVPSSSVFGNHYFNLNQIYSLLHASQVEFSYDTSSDVLVYPTGYFQEVGTKGSFSNILVLDNKPDNARVLVDYRWHSIDDINIQTSFWSRKFDISYNTTVNSTRYNFKQWGDNFTDTVIDLNDTFENPFLVSFPIENRTFHYLNKNGQDSTLAAIFANTVHQSIIDALNSPNSIYNSLDIFVAYAYLSGNNIYVSKWSQFYRDLQGNLNGVTSSDVGFIDSGQASQNSFHYVYDMTNEEKNTTSIINDYGNPNAQTVVNNIFDTSQFDTTQTIQNLNQSYQGVFQMVQNVPQMFSQLFSFMPSWVTTLLAVSIGLLVIVGLIKALL